jgi:hypothetical protein
MEAEKKTRPVDRERKAAESQAPRGGKQFVLPMTQEEYNEWWSDPVRVRARLEEFARNHPERVPEDFEQGFALHGMGRESSKLPGIRLRKVVLINEESYWLRPSFVFGYMMGTIDELEYPLLLASYGVPAHLLTRGFGHSDMFWQRHLERLGLNSLVGTTICDPGQLPDHLAADEHHADWVGQTGYIATTAGKGCILGIALTDSADEVHLTAAYGVFAEEARNVDPEYAPQTVNTDGWAATQNAFKSLFATISVVLCFLHGFLKVRDRCRKSRDLHGRIWDVYHATSAEEFRRLMEELKQWCLTQTFPAAVNEMLAKLWKKTEYYAQAYDHPGCHRTSNAVDRPMNRLRRIVYAGRGLHGHQASSEMRLRGWALLLNFRPFAPRSNCTRDSVSLAHQLNGKCYHQHWLHNLMVSSSLMGTRPNAPAI